MTERKKFLTALCSTCQNIIFAVDYDQALSSLVKNAAHCLNAKASSIRLIDRSGKTLQIAATYGLSKSYLKKGPVQVAKSPIDRMALRGKIVQIKDVSKDKLFQYPREAKKEGIKSVVCLALKCRDRLLGVLRIYTDKQRIFNRQEITFIKTLAFQGAAAIRHAQRYKRLKSLNVIGKTITSQLKIQKVPHIICQSAADDMSAKGASIMLINRDTGQLEVAATYGLSEDFIHKGPLKIDKSISRCLKGQDTIIADADKDKRIQYPQAVKKEGIKSIICIPLKLRDKVIGTLRIYTAYRYKLNQEDLEFLHILADFGVAAIENARLYTHVKRDYEDLTRDVWKWYGWGERPPQM
jgi:signal transduction protein with GAF and PtsI domain